MTIYIDMYILAWVICTYVHTLHIHTHTHTHTHMHTHEVVVAKTHRILYIYRSFPAKVTYI